jgi:hypothetical protein
MKIDDDEDTSKQSKFGGLIRLPNMSSPPVVDA